MPFRNRAQLQERLLNALLANYGTYAGLRWDEYAEAFLDLWESEVGYDEDASEFAAETAFCVSGEEE